MREQRTDTADAAAGETRSARTADPRWLAPIAWTSSLLNRIAATFAAILLVLMTGHILLEIGLRAFSRSTYMADVLVGYGVAAITFLAMAWALEQGTMIRVQIITQRLGVKGRWLAEAFAIVSSWLLLALLATHQWTTLARAWTRETMSQHYIQVPLWIPEAFFFVGLMLLLLHLVVRFLRLLAVGLTEDEGLVL